MKVLSRFLPQSLIARVYALYSATLLLFVGSGLVLFLVPSIALLGQTLREWSAEADEAIQAICVCSDAEITKKRSKNDDADVTSVVDLALP